MDSIPDGTRWCFISNPTTIIGYEAVGDEVRLCIHLGFVSPWRLIEEGTRRGRLYTGLDSAMDGSDTRMSTPIIVESSDGAQV